jgi:very-short-patch-repair endonuclease
VIAGRSAAHLYGAPFVDADAPVEVLVPRTANVRMAGVCAHVAALDPSEVVRRDGLPITSPLRTCRDLTQWVPDSVEAIVMIDALAARKVVSLPELEAYACDRTGQRGWRRLLDAARLADAGAGSPQESRLRVRLVRAGLPRPVTQFVIVCDGRFIARSDLAWPEYQVAVEYDGVWHAESPAQIHADRRRLNDMIAAGWVVLHVTSKRLRDDFDGFVRELRRVLQSRGAL